MMHPSLRTILTLVPFGLTAAISTAAGTDGVTKLRQKGFSDAWIQSLTDRGEPRVYSGDELRLIGQPVGGQYAGQLYIGGDGRLWFWDLFNRRLTDPGGPGDLHYNQPLKPDDFRSVASGFVIECEGRARPLDGSSFSDVRFRGEYPIARVTFAEEGAPNRVALEAFSPFCPTDTATSSLPLTLLNYTVSNESDRPIEFRIIGLLENAACRSGVESGALLAKAAPLTEAVGMHLTAVGDADHGSDANATPAADSGSLALALLNSEGAVGATAIEGLASNATIDAATAASERFGVVSSRRLTLATGESKELRFAIAWRFANGHLGSTTPGSVPQRADLRHYYGKRFKDAASVIAAVADDHDRLTDLTRKWRDTWYDSSLPVWFLDRTFFNVSTLATSACFRYQNVADASRDGRVYFWEGLYLGEGTCTHVTHYEQAFGRLFPDAARQQRSITDYDAGWDDDLGYVRYRAEWGIGHHFGIPHAIDGHAGTLLRTYREHTTSADDEFLRSVWPRVKRAARFMIDQDAGVGFFAERVPEAARGGEPDGVLEGPQYNTLDKVWDGYIPWTSGIYLASLRAAAEMARDMDDPAFADQCDAIIASGREKLARLTYESDYGYYVQRPVDTKTLVNSNMGCHIDQVIGDYWTHQVGLGQALPRDLTRNALGKLFEHNFYRRIGDYRENADIKCVRYYCDDDEPGMLICTFPHGGARGSAPSIGNDWDALVVGYFSECMTGFTYQAAAHMISEGMVTEGLALCRAIHDRYAEAPSRRNPFNEVEYGSHYTRAMASYGAYIAMTGFDYHGPRGRIGFAPRLGADAFRGAFTTAQGWGTYSQKRDQGAQTVRLALAHGLLDLNEVTTMLASGHQANQVVASVGGDAVAVEHEQQGDRVTVRLSQPLRLAPGAPLEIVLR